MKLIFQLLITFLFCLSDKFNFMSSVFSNKRSDNRRGEMWNIKDTPLTWKSPIHLTACANAWWKLRAESCIMYTCPLHAPLTDFMEPALFGVQTTVKCCEIMQFKARAELIFPPAKRPRSICSQADLKMGACARVAPIRTCQSFFPTAMALLHPNRLLESSRAVGRKNRCATCTNRVTGRKNTAPRRHCSFFNAERIWREKKELERHPFGLVAREFSSGLAVFFKLANQMWRWKSGICDFPPPTAFC